MAHNAARPHGSTKAAAARSGTGRSPQDVVLRGRERIRARGLGLWSREEPTCLHP